LYQDVRDEVLHNAAVSIDQREFARIETNVLCSVATGSTSFEAKVLNLSLSGAGLLGPPGAAERGESVTLMLEHQEGLMSFALSAAVVRIAPQGELAVYGVHFEALPPDVRGELVMMLRMIAAGRGSERRAAPRVASRVVVTCGTQDSFRAVLNDLSRGGFSVRCKRELKPGDILQAKFGVEGLPALLDLQGPVVNITPLPDGFFRVGAKFDPLPEASLTRVMHLLEVLMGLAPRQGVIVEEDEDDDEDPAP